MGSIFGRAVIVPLTNKSGSGVIAGDIVVIDSANDRAFTTTTTAGFTSGVGIAQETIASNATGRVLLEGYAALVNVNASVTRGNFGKTHTVAKQATDAGATRGAGTFCRFLSGGTTPDAYVWPADLLGSSLTDPTTTRGDLIRRGAGAIERVALGTTGQALVSDGTDAVWGYPTLSQATVALASDQTIGSADTATNVTSCSLSLAAGTWLLIATAEMLVDTAGGYGGIWICKNDNSGIIGQGFARGATSALNITLACHGIATPGATTTYKLRAQMSGTTGKVLVDPLGIGAAVGTRLTAIRLA